MSLTSAQLATLKTDITVTHASTVFNSKTLLQLWNGYDTQGLADYYNTTASPTVAIWRPDVSQTDLAKSIVASDFSALTVALQNTWFALLQAPILDATISSVRQNFSTIFTSGTTLTNLQATAQKNATNLESLFTTSQVSSVYGY